MSRNTGKRPHELALELFAKKATVSPSELEAHVGNGPYASKHIWFLRKLGHDILINKDGRTVVSYTYNGSGSAASAPAKAVKAKPISKAEERRTKAAQKPFELKKPVDEVEATFGSSGAATSYSVDPDWDAVEDVKTLL